MARSVDIENLRLVFLLFENNNYYFFVPAYWALKLVKNSQNTNIGAGGSVVG
jgi:hypothetical protein